MSDIEHAVLAAIGIHGERFTYRRIAQGIKSESLAIYNAGIELWKFLARNNLIANNPEPRPRGHKTKNARKKRRKQS